MCYYKSVETTGAGIAADGKGVVNSMRDENCIFCKIANGEIPSKTLYEDARFRVILDLGPAAKGHALLLPKEHFANIGELPEDQTAEAFVLARKMAVRMQKRLHADGFNLVQNNGVAAGQTVFHFHIHLIPRYLHDGQKIGWEPGRPEEGELEEIRQLLAKE